MRYAYPQTAWTSICCLQNRVDLLEHEPVPTFVLCQFVTRRLMYNHRQEQERKSLNGLWIRVLVSGWTLNTHTHTAPAIEMFYRTRYTSNTFNNWSWHWHEIKQHVLWYGECKFSGVSPVSGRSSGFRSFLCVFRGVLEGSVLRDFPHPARAVPMGLRYNFVCSGDCTVRQEKLLRVSIYDLCSREFPVFQESCLCSREFPTAP
jgi:hypothetical protein